MSQDEFEAKVRHIIRETYSALGQMHLAISKHGEITSNNFSTSPESAIRLIGVIKQLSWIEDQLTKLSDEVHKDYLEKTKHA